MVVIIKELLMEFITSFKDFYFLTVLFIKQKYRYILIIINKKHTKTK